MDIKIKSISLKQKSRLGIFNKVSHVTFKIEGEGVNTASKVQVFALEDKDDQRNRKNELSVVMSQTTSLETLKKNNTIEVSLSLPQKKIYALQFVLTSKNIETSYFYYPYLQNINLFSTEITSTFLHNSPFVKLHTKALLGKLVGRSLKREVPLVCLKEEDGILIRLTNPSDLEHALITGENATVEIILPNLQLPLIEEVTFNLFDDKVAFSITGRDIADSDYLKISYGTSPQLDMRWDKINPPFSQTTKQVVLPLPGNTLPTFSIIPHRDRDITALTNIYTLERPSQSHLYLDYEGPKAD